MISFNANAIPAAVQELIRNITFRTTATDPQTLARYVRFTLVDESANTSNLPYAVVVQNLRPTTLSSDNGSVTIADSSRAGKDDRWRLERLGPDLKLTDDSANTIDVSSISGSIGNATSIVTAPFNVFWSTGQLLLDMRQGSDALTLDFTSGDPLPQGGILYVCDPPLGRGDELTIVSATPGAVTYPVDPATGKFVGLPEGSVLSVDSTTLYITYLAGDGNDVLILPVQAPTTTAAADQQATDGVSAVFSLASFTDPDGGPWSVDVDWGDGSLHTTFTTTSAGSLSQQSHIYAEEGTGTITVTVTDITTLSNSSSFTVNVADAPPTI